MTTNPLHATETSQDRAAGHSYISRPRSVFDTVADLLIYRDRWHQRCTLYQLRRSYYKGTIYQDWPAYVVSLGLYSGIRQVYSPLKKAVRTDVAKLPAKWAMPEKLTERHRNAITAWREAHQADQTYARAVKYGAVAGEFGLMLHYDANAGSLEPIALRPDEVITGSLSTGDPFGLIIKTGLVDRAGIHEYAQLITPATITTFRNGFQFDYDGGGAKRANALGYVPLTLAPYIIGEDGTGESSFSHTQEQLDRVNDAVSQALDVVQRNSEPWLILSGVNKSQISMQEDNNAIVLSEQAAKAYTVAPNLAIADALALIQDVKAEMKSQLPQLIYDELIGRSDLAYDSILTLCGPLIDHIHEARRNVDAAIVQLERRAIEAANALQIAPLAGLNPIDHKLDEERPVIQPTPGQAIDLEQKRVNLEHAKNPPEQPQQPQQPQPARPGRPAPAKKDRDQ